jgi:hypothetical protein
MRGHWIGGTRKLNKHWQSGEGSIAEFSRWFTTIKRGDDYYCFAPSYAFHDLTPIAFKHGYPYVVEPAVKNTWVSFGTHTLVPSFNNEMTANGTYTLEDMRENGTVFTRTLTASDRVKVIIPTYKLSIILSSNPAISTTTIGYRYDSTPTLPNDAEILWQDDNDLINYERRYADSLGIVRNSWNAWQAYYPGLGQGKQNIDIYPDLSIEDYPPDYMHCDMRLGYYDHDTSYSGVPNAVNLMSPVMQQLHRNVIGNLVMPFNNTMFYYNSYRDSVDNIQYQAIINYELISLDLQERVIV